MKEKLVRSIKNFLSSQQVSEKPLLIGYSGGADSTALVHLLSACRDTYPLQLHLVHIDHGWRAESGEQAAILKEQALSLSLTFHLYRLQGPTTEEKAREARLSLFKELAEDIDAQSLMLAHHRDDQAETILKRIFEGSHLYALSGMRKASCYEGMPIWRPLLDVSKTELLTYLREEGISHFDDETNRDPHYLRARMRTQLFPEVERVFAKGIGKNLTRLGLAFQEIASYFDKKTAPLWKGVEKEGEAIRCDLTPFFPLEQLEVHHFLIRLLQKEKIFLSAPQVEALEGFILNRASGKELLTKRHQFLIKKGKVFIYPVRR